MNGLLIKIGVFYGFLALGMFARGYIPADLQKKTGRLLVNYALPYIFFMAALHLKDSTLFSVTALAFASSLFIFSLAAAAGESKSEARALGTMSAWANNAFIGMPLAFTLFGARGLEVASLWAAGSITFFALVSSTISAPTNGQATNKAWLFARKIFSPPYIPAFALGYALNRNGLVPTGYLGDALSFSKTAIFIISILYVGSCLELKSEMMKSRLIKSALFFKHLVYPLLVFVLLTFDRYVTHIFLDTDHNVLMLMGTMPIAINAVVLFQEKAHLRAQAAFCVTVSTLITAVMAAGFIYWGAPVLQ
jgi:predicted permease